jgi:hypothetical protein
MRSSMSFDGPFRCQSAIGVPLMPEATTMTPR